MAIGTPAYASATDITARAIPLFSANPRERSIGHLHYRGGLDLTSGDRRFGGLSDIAISTDGTRILAVSDKSFWFRARLTYDAGGDLVGLTRAEMASMLNLAGEAMFGKEGDAEGLALEMRGEIDGAVAVSFERDVRVWRYDLSHGFGARPTNVPIGDWTQHLRYNDELEAIALVGPHALLAIAEDAPGKGDIPAALEAYPGSAGRIDTRPLTIAVHKPFSVTSAAPAFDGGMFLLERRFSLLGGLGAEIRRVPAGEIHAGARIEGTVLAEFVGGDANIDNMEGIAVRRGPRGETLLYIVSDDNYSPLERTVLMMFEVVQ